MNEQELIALHIETAAVLDSGQRIAAQAAKRPITGRECGSRRVGYLGKHLHKPAEFWAGAAGLETGGDNEALEVIALGVRMASAQMRIGNLDFAREALIGQSQWCSVLAVKLGAQADGETSPERQGALIKLALAAQRQAGQALATAAALNKLSDDVAVTVGD